VANYLTKELGVKGGDFVMHLQNNSLERRSCLSISGLGGLDILYAAEVCNPKVFVLGSEFLPVVQPVRKDLKTVKRYICVGDDAPKDMIDYKTIAAYQDASEAIVDVEDQHGPAMMFTSGITGKPKAVIHTHLSLNNTAIGNAMSYFVEKNDNYVFFLPLYHSGALFLRANLHRVRLNS